MKRTTVALVLACAALLAGASADAAQRLGRVCPDPSRPCAGFKAHDLSFALPSDSVARAEVRSDSFYAVILRSGSRCSIAESERRAAQAVFPRNKVFSQRFECDDDVENNVTYTNVSTSAGFMAVYAGGTRAQANAFLTRVRATGRFPGAYLRRMRVVYVYS
jgi:hypothetical protein